MQSPLIVLSPAYSLCVPCFQLPADALPASDGIHSETVKVPESIYRICTSRWNRIWQVSHRSGVCNHRGRRDRCSCWFLISVAGHRRSTDAASHQWGNSGRRKFIRLKGPLARKTNAAARYDRRVGRDFGAQRAEQGSSSVSRCLASADVVSNQVCPAC